MCGIAGYCITKEDEFGLDLRRLTKALGLGIEPRGKDATGIATVNSGGHVRIAKQAIAASQFFDVRQGIGRMARVALIHTRAATQGSPTNNANNHPIDYKTIVGIHNGMLWNDDDIFDDEKWHRHAQVDSEAIFAAIHHKADPVDALETIDGSYAVAWIDRATPLVLNLARGHHNPICWSRSTGGSLFFASTENALIDGMKAAGIVFPVDAKESSFVTHMDEGEFISMNAETGVLEDRPRFAHDGRNATYTSGRRRMAAYTWGYTTNPKVQGDGWSTLNLGKTVKTLGNDPSEPPRGGLDGPPDDIIDGFYDDIRPGDIIEMCAGGEVLTGEITGIVDDGTNEVMVDFGEQFIQLDRVKYTILKGV